MHTNSMLLMRDFRERYLGDLKGCTILDVGARQVSRQRDSYRDLFYEYQYTGMDIVPGKNVDVVGYENLAKVYDVVISGQVMEHVARPWEWMCALAGLFRRYICIIAPSRSKEHRYPIDCYRYLPDGMRALFEYAGIVTIEARLDKTDCIGIGTKWSDIGAKIVSGGTMNTNR